MKSKFYTFLIASSNEGRVRRVRIPHTLVHLLAVLVVVGGVTVFAAMTSYSRMLWKVTNYNELRTEKATLQKQYTRLQSVVTDTNQRLSSLQSLATEVAMTYGIIRFRQTPFGLSEGPAGAEAEHQRSLEQFAFLKKNATAIALASQGLRLMPGSNLADLALTPSLWPVQGRITGSFGDRLDPFSGEGTFHAGVDISSSYGDAVRSAADGLVVAVETRPGYGRVIVVDHGFGTSTWYGHLSGWKSVV